jgi:hypothetical protein
VKRALTLAAPEQIARNVEISAGLVLALERERVEDEAASQQPAEDQSKQPRYPSLFHLALPQPDC